MQQEGGMDEYRRIADHLSLDEVKMKMQTNAGFMKMQKWLVIYNAIIDPRPVSEIAKHTGLSEASVHRIIEEYNLLGPRALESKGKIIHTVWYEQLRRSASL
jgi:hypothetical protein